MDKIVLNNGREIEGATVVRPVWSDHMITVSAPNTDLVQMAILFGNSENTKNIEYYTTILKYTYTGYTTLANIGINYDGTGIDVSLKGDESAKMEQSYTIPHNFIPEVIANSINEKEKNQNGPETAGNDSDGQA